MAERTKKNNCIILHVHEIEEKRSLVTVLSDSQGLFSATLYGGAKSHLRSLIEPYTCGILSLYEKGDDTESYASAKITEFEAQTVRLSFRQSLFKMWAANLAAEIVIKTRGAGDTHDSYVLLSAFLTGLDAVSEEEGRTALYRFLWRYLNLLGQMSNPGICSVCKRRLLTQNRPVYFAVRNNTFECETCYSHESALTDNARNANANGTVGAYSPVEDFELDLDGITYLCAINELPPSKARKLPLSPSSQDKLKRFLFYEIQKACGEPLTLLKNTLGVRL